MLKMSFTVRMKLRLKGRCSRHPRYNPEQGEGVIRGGCSQCLALYQVIAARDRANAALKVLEELATPYQVQERRRGHQTQIGVEHDHRRTPMRSS